MNPYNRCIMTQQANSDSLELRFDCVLIRPVPQDIARGVAFLRRNRLPNGSIKGVDAGLS